MPGDIFHVDSIVSESGVKFQAVHQYGRPPMQVMHEGRGVHHPHRGPEQPARKGN